jgi:sugar phosphate isomerase/epimerase
MIAMATYSRRGIVAAALAAAAAGSRMPAQPAGKMRLGVVTGLGPDPDAAIKRVHDLGFPSCQVSAGEATPALAAALRKALDKYGVEVDSTITGGPGREIYDFYQGPLTIGFVPRDLRAARIAKAKKVSDFAKAARIATVQGHCGFIPENPNEPLYTEAVEAIRTVAQYCKNNGQAFRMETGQETPITLVRAIKDVGLDNVCVNFDAANLVLYGKANPVDAVDTLGPYIKGVHAKDGTYPMDPKKLGNEVPIGEGKVNFPVVIDKLKKLGYTGVLTIEREIRGEKQTADILAAKKYLTKLIG